MTVKRYHFNVVEEGVLNPKFQGYRGGRIEVTDIQSESDYAVYEAKFLIPEEFMDAFREVFDFKSSDLMPYLRWDCRQ